MAGSPIGGAHALVTNNSTDRYRAVSIGTINMIARINAACRTHRIPVSTFGRRAVNDPRLVPDLIDGRLLRPATEEKILRFIAGLEETQARSTLPYIDPQDMPDLYAIKGVGTCMEPLFADGVSLVGDKREKPEAGDTVIVHFTRVSAVSTNGTDLRL